MFNAIYILWLRQLKRYFRSPARMIGSLGQPLLFLVALGFGLNPTFQKAGQGNYLQFIAPGVINMAIMFMAVFSGFEVIWDRQFGFLKETLVAPVSRLNIMLGRTLGGATIACIQGVMVLILAILFGFRPYSLNMLPLTILVMFLIAVLFTSLGTAIGSVLQDMHGFQLIMSFLIMPLFFLSGALFPLTNLPAMLNLLVKLNPLTYGVDALRTCLIGNAHLGLGLDIGVLVILAMVFLAIGSYLFSKIQI